MKLSTQGERLIKTFEGLRLKAYRDTGGVWTIGWGHTADVTEHLEITLAEAKTFFRNDVTIVEGVVANATVGIELTQGQFDALVSFTFNLGGARLRGSTLLRKLREGKPARDVANELLRWCYDNGRVVNGLLKRRIAERALYLGEEA